MLKLASAQIYRNSLGSCMSLEHVIFNNKSDLIFDLDGTLVDSVPDLAAAVNDMLSRLSLASFPEETIRGWVGNGAKTLVERALSGSGNISSTLDSDYTKQALDIFLEHYQRQACVKTSLYAGVEMALSALVDRGYTLHIVTNKPLIFVDPIVSHLNIKQYFTHILGADSLPKKKPDPMPLAYVMKQQRVSAGNCVMIGDSHNDILAANAIEMESVGLTYGYNYGEDISLHNPTVVFENFDGLLSVFPSLKEG
mgnify:CR=1 FL=1